MNQTKRHEIFSRLHRQNPRPKGELRYRSRFELLVAVILSAQATDISVNKATKELFKKANTAKKMHALGEQRLKSYIRTIGLFNSKAKNIIKTCKILVENYAGKIPVNRSDEPDQKARNLLTPAPAKPAPKGRIALSLAL